MDAVIDAGKYTYDNFIRGKFGLVDFIATRTVYHEHFSLKDDFMTTLFAHPEILGKAREYTETFFDTRDDFLLKHNMWLRCRHFFDQRDVEWVLKAETRSAFPLNPSQPEQQSDGLTYREYVGTVSVMAALHEFFARNGRGAVIKPVTPVSYCPRAIVALRGRRYNGAPSMGKWWIDVCHFKPSHVYVVGTLETDLSDKPTPVPVSSPADSLRGDLAAPSKIIAYIAQYRDDLVLPTSIARDQVKAVANVLIYLSDPFGGGEFQPAPALSDEDESSDNTCLSHNDGRF